MSYMLTFYKSDKCIDQRVADTLEDAHNLGVEFVNDRMEAFGEDREALKNYGYIDAENAALAIGEDGGVVHVPDGYKMEVINTDANDS
jgi:hypothetical protein